MRVTVLGLVLSLLFFVPCVESKELQRVGALGRIDPQGGVVSLSGPPGDTIASVCAKEGDFVQKGAPLVIFQSKAVMELELSLAEIALREADEAGALAVSLQELRLKQAEEGRGQSIAQQELKFKSLKEEQELIARRYQRFLKIGGESLSAQQMDERQTETKVAQLKLNSAAGELKSTSASTQTNVDLAAAELNRLRLSREVNVKRASRQVELIREKLKNSILRAPSDGTVLEVLQREGETSGGRPIIRVGDLEHMYVVADVYDRDLLRVKPGMKADVTSKSLPAPLTGVVETIGRVIMLPARTALVKIRLDDARLAAQLINVEVDVSIQLQ